MTTWSGDPLGKAHAKNVGKNSSLMRVMLQETAVLSLNHDKSVMKAKFSEKKKTFHSMK